MMPRRKRWALALPLVLSIAVSGQTFLQGPYTGAPGRTSVTISWKAEPVGSARIEYAVLRNGEPEGEWNEVDWIPSEGAPAGRVHFDLLGLVPNTEYAYRVALLGDGQETWSPRGRFRTAPVGGESVAFAVLSDTQWQGEGVNRLELVGNAIRNDPTPFHFILHAGDLVESPTASMWDHWFSSFDGMLLRAPFLPVLGNHEHAHTSYYDAFEFPPGGGRAGERWWALHWGDVVVVGLDTNVRATTDYVDQVAWASDHLSGAERHKVVLLHHPPFSSDPFHGGRALLGAMFHPLFTELGVDMVISGHAHNYERIERDGITYLVIGGGGAVPRPLGDVRVDGSVRAVSDHHFYVRVFTSDERIAVEVPAVAIEQGGEVEPLALKVLDSFSIPKEEARRAGWLGVAIGAVLLAGAIALGLLLTDRL